VARRIVALGNLKPRVYQQIHWLARRYLGMLELERANQSLKSEESLLSLFSDLDRPVAFAERMAADAV
jgi:hypothetical protein